jgi:HEPN domain-containing protein
MSINPLNEVKYRHRLAIEHLERARKLFSVKDWVGTVLSSQPAVENFTKAVISAFEVPTWSHDPSNQLKSLIDRLPTDLVEDVQELAVATREMAPEHGKASYGEPTAGLTPSDIYEEEHASNALKKTEKARKIAEKVLERLNIRL